MGKRALVIEDDSNIAELLRLYLGKDVTRWLCLSYQSVTRL